MRSSVGKSPMRQGHTQGALSRLLRRTARLVSLKGTVSSATMTSGVAAHMRAGSVMGRTRARTRRTEERELVDGLSQHARLTWCGAADSSRRDSGTLMKTHMRCALR